MVRNVVVLTAALLGLTASAAMATTITVTTTADVVANDGQCSLREAITAANTDTASGSAPGECPAGTPAGNVIVLGPGDYSLTLGELQVSSPVTLVGHGVGATTINGNGISRELDVLSNGGLTVESLSLLGGHAPNGTAATGSIPGTQGGGGGAILNAGSLALEGVAVSANSAGAGGLGANGSGAGDAPGAGGGGGAIESTGQSLSIVDSTIAGNGAGTGGNAGGSSSPVGGAGGAGGGVDASAGFVNITGSTISGNIAGNGGFGGFIGGVAGNGGGLSFSGSVTATLANDTIDDNQGGHTGQPLPPAGSNSDGGAIVQTGGTVAMTQVTIAYNQEDDSFSCCHNVSTIGGMTITDSALDASCTAGVNDGGHNVSLAGEGCPGEQISPASFDLGPLQNNGGPTETLLPGPGSALIDEVPSSGAGCLPTDQRGVARPQGSACDAGSVEAQPPVITITPGHLKSPARLKFGRRMLGHTRRETVKVVYSSGDSPLALGKAAITGAGRLDFKIVKNRCRGKTLSQGQSCTLVISFTPRRRGALTAKATVSVKRPGTPVKISLVGTGVR
jgi:CSLREA domain-containing protein